MRQVSEDRVLYYRQLRETVQAVFLPELQSALARDSAALVDRILAEFIVEEESAASLSAEYGHMLHEALNGEPLNADPIPADFHALRAEAANAVATAGVRPEEQALARRLVAIEHEFLERVDELRTPVLAEPAVNHENSTGVSVTAEQLGAYLQRRCPESPNIRVESVVEIPGGRSKETILVSLSGSTLLPHEVILRKDRAVGLLQTKAASEFAILQVVHDFGGVPVPEPLLVEWEGSELGPGTFQIMERVAGEKAGEYFPDLASPSAHRAAIGRQIASALARLHAIPLERLAETGLALDEATITNERVTADVEGIAAQIRGLSGPPCAAVPLAHRWLLEHVGDVVPAPRLALLQGDLGLHNMLIDGDRLTALLDWEVSAIGPPARDLAKVTNAATALMPWDDFIAAYLAAGGHVEDCDARTVQFYRVQGALGGFMASRLGGHLFRSGVKRDLLTAHSGLDSHFRSARNLSRTLTAVMESDDPL
jgi:aminoglycoside phosphotransferase (APT) family kinase protein